MGGGARVENSVKASKQIQRFWRKISGSRTTSAFVKKMDEHGPTRKFLQGMA
jgi:hypothetical protein